VGPGIRKFTVNSEEGVRLIVNGYPNVVNQALPPLPAVVSIAGFGPFDT
jgi:hypothetical protein